MDPCSISGWICPRMPGVSVQYRSAGLAHRDTMERQRTMLKKTKWKLAGPGVILSALLGFVPQASAQSSDYKSYPSSMCVSNGSISYATEYAWVGGGGVMYCPVVRDRYGSTYNQHAYVNVSDLDASRNLTCTLSIGGPWTAWSDWDSDSTSGSSGDDTLYMYVSTGSDSSTTSYRLSCSFPTGSTQSLRVMSYRTYEYNLYD